MRSEILYCPHLGRDITALRAVAPEALVQVGEPTAPGCDGCLAMHLQAVRYALLEGAQALWVMEDDCAFTPHFTRDRWLADAAWAQAHGYDVLAGGCTRTYGERVVRDGILEVSAFHSAHCVVYFASGFARVLQAVQPLDLSLGRDCGLRCALVYPFVAVQAPAFSGILQQPVDYGPLYDAHEARLGHALGMRAPFQPMPVY